MNNSIFTRKATPGNSGEQNLNQMRDDLARLEAATSDPQETVATIECFAHPSAVLRRLAIDARRCH